MAKSRYSFFDTVFNTRISHSQKGMPSQSLIELFQDDSDIIYTIDIKNQYRPDLIAREFYGDPKLYWIIVYANNINDSPEGFYATRNIRVPKYDRVLEII